MIAEMEPRSIERWKHLRILGLRGKIENKNNALLLTQVDTDLGLGEQMRVSDNLEKLFMNSNTKRSQ